MPGPPVNSRRSAVGCAKSPCEVLQIGTALGRFCARGGPLECLSITRPQARRPRSHPTRFQHPNLPSPRTVRGGGSRRQLRHPLQPCHSPLMSRYRRPRIEGGIFFFTAVLVDRSSELLVQNIERFRQVYRAVRGRLPFETNAICILPDHLHAIWTLPPGEADFALRWSQIKTGFSRGLVPARLRSWSQVRRRETGHLATTSLGARNPRRCGLRASHRLHSFQSGETRLCHSGLRLAVQQFPPVREKRFVAGRLGRRSGRDPGPIRGVIDPSGRPRAQNRPEALPASTSRGAILHTLRFRSAAKPSLSS
jgi:REP element-mobilizing transposase RayT